MVYDDNERADTPSHLDGLQADDAYTFADWRHPKFLEVCAAHRDATVEYGYRWALGVVNGVFDLCHLGHVNLCQQAVEYGGCLRGSSIFLVALLNSDESVRRLKGPGRPIIPLPARMWQLGMHHGVQAVAAFAEDTPAEALAALRPDFLFKGESYRGQEIPGAAACGAVVFLPETPGVSTTEIERRIVAAHGGAAGVPRTGHPT